jgi:hypothetical protein
MTSTAERVRDGALAVAFVGVVVAVAPTPSSLPAVVVGAVGTLATEWLLSRRAATVRRLWRRRSVRAGSFLGSLVAATVAAALLGDAVWTAVVAGGVTYLCVLVAAELRARA